MSLFLALCAQFLKVCIMPNLGIANPKVELLNVLPNVVKDGTKRIQLELLASQYPALADSGVIKPILTEFVQNTTKSFSVVFPSRRKMFVNNYLRGGGALPNTKEPYIVWTPCLASNGSVAQPGIMGTVEKGDNTSGGDSSKKKWPKYTLIQPGNTYPNGYNGPIWIQTSLQTQAMPDDAKIFKESISGFLPTTTTSTTSTTSPVTTTSPTSLTTKQECLPFIAAISQEVSMDGLWWGVESSSFVGQNMPFWVDIKRSEPPTSSDFETIFVIGFGHHDTSATKNRFDIVIGANRPPQIVDYRNSIVAKANATTGSGSGASNATASTANKKEEIVQTVEFADKENEGAFSAIGTNVTDLEIGVMTVSGRLLVTVNGESFIYERNTEEDVEEIVIPAGPIRVFGTNVQSIIYASPMSFCSTTALLTFAPVTLYGANLSIPVSTTTSTSTTTSANPGTTTTTTSATTTTTTTLSPNSILNYFNVEKDGNPGTSAICLLPSKNQKEMLYGVDCRIYSEAVGLPTTDASGGTTQKSRTESPSGFAMHRQGVIGMLFSYQNPSLDKTKIGDCCFVVLKADNVYFPGTKFIIPFGGCPYFYRLKGVAEQKGRTAPTLTTENISSSIMQVSESWSTGDISYTEKKVSLTLYNEDGKWNKLRTKQYGVRLYWAWKTTSSTPTYTKSFTGFTIAAQTTDEPGKETITVECVDYIAMIRSLCVLNCPFYDGMLARYVIEDLARIAGLTSFKYEWPSSEPDYFLPSGYSFTQPRHRYPSDTPILDCMSKVAKLPEAFFYFDKDGTLVMERTPGGFFSNNASTLVKASFSSDPASTNVILGQKSVSWNYSASINQISGQTVHKDTRNTIFYAVLSSSSTDMLLYRKYMVIKEAMLGGMPEIREWMMRILRRMEYPIRKISFKTVEKTPLDIKPMDFVTVDGLIGRITSMSRKYSADNNTFETDFETEWLGGK